MLTNDLVSFEQLGRDCQDGRLTVSRPYQQYFSHMGNIFDK